MLRFKILTAAIAVGLLPLEGLWAQQAMIPVTTGGSSPPAVPHGPPSDDSPEEIAKDAARDLKDSRFYNKPGATRAQYDADWQECRLIARGSRTPTGTVPYFYNPAVISPLAAGVGAGLGGLIAGAIQEGVQRRANRRACLLIKGWRMVEVPEAEATRIAALDDQARSAYFDTIVGAEQVSGKVTERIRFTTPEDPKLTPSAPFTGTGSLFLGKKVDAAVPLQLADGEAAVVLAFRRPDEGSAGRTGRIAIARYDAEGRDLVYRPKDWKKKGDKTTYNLAVNSIDRKAPYEVHVLRVTPGDYVITGTSAGPALIMSTYCFGGPTFRIAAGDILYLGDFVPYLAAPLSTGERLTALAYTPQLQDAQRVLADKQPALAAALSPATIRNQATYACSAVTMERWDIPGAEPLPVLPATVETASSSD